MIRTIVKPQSEQIRLNIPKSIQVKKQKSMADIKYW